VRGTGVTMHDGFWLPERVRTQVLSVDAASPGAVAIRAPRLTRSAWLDLLAGLSAARGVPSHEASARWAAALLSIREKLIVGATTMLPVLATATGYSVPMLATALWHGNLASPDRLVDACRFWPTWSIASRWESMPGLAGKARFFPARRIDRAVAGLRRNQALARPAPPVDSALGYAAGNVPGTALLIAMLAGAANGLHQNGDAAPAVLIRNSRHEPLFAPWVLSVVEAVDPDLVASTAVMLWDYENTALQSDLMRQAGLLIAAAGDPAIAHLEALRVRHAPGCRFHRHGHKVSFAVIAQPAAEAARLAAVDSSLWDQNGCLSARIHFVEGDAEAYAHELARQMRSLAVELPRGSTPRRLLHRAFDAHAALAAAGEDVSVFSNYDDDFAVILDRRTWTAASLMRAVNACAGRTVVVRPVASAQDVPGYLRWLPAANLQSVSVALPAGQVLEFASAAGACGVTALRILGRAAFPQLAYSWDGLLPLDVGSLRPQGHFTTVEFDDPAAEMAESLEQWGLAQER
jgi:hypothetical protein